MENSSQNSQPQEQKPKNPMTQKQAAWMLVGAGTEFAAYIAAPLLVFLLVIEPHYNPGHKSKMFMVIGLLVCLAISAIAIGKAIADIKKKLK